MTLHNRQSFQSLKICPPNHLRETLAVGQYLLVPPSEFFVDTNMATAAAEVSTYCSTERQTSVEQTKSFFDELPIS